MILPSDASPVLGWNPVEAVTDAVGDAAKYAFEKAVKPMVSKYISAQASVICAAVKGGYKDTYINTATAALTAAAASISVGVGALAAPIIRKLVVGAVDLAVASKCPPALPTPATPVAPSGRILGPAFSTAILNTQAVQTMAAQLKQEKVARYNTTRKVWSIYQKIPTLNGYDGPCTSCGLGDALSTVPPDGMVKVGEAPTKPADATDGGTERDPWYKNWKVLAAIGGGAALVGAGAFVALR